MNDLDYMLDTDSKAYAAMRIFVEMQNIATIFSRDHFPADIVICHDSLSMPAASVISQKLSADLYFDAVEVTDISKRSSVSFRTLPGEYKQHYNYAINKSVKEAKVVLTVGEAMGEYVKEKHNLANIYSISNVRPLKTCVCAPSEKNVRTDLGLNLNVPLLVSTGNLYYIEGLEVFLKIIQEWPEAHLALVGASAKKVYIDKIKSYKLDDRVHFLPPMPWESLPAYINAADIGIVPWGFDDKTPENLAISNPNRIYDYIAASLPFISSDVPDIRSVIDKYECGKISNSENLKADLLDIYSNADKYRVRLLTAKEKLNAEMEMEKFLNLFPRKPLKILFVANKDVGQNARIKRMADALYQSRGAQVTFCLLLKPQIMDKRYLYFYYDNGKIKRIRSVFVANLMRFVQKKINDFYDLYFMRKLTATRLYRAIRWRSIRLMSLIKNIF